MKKYEKGEEFVAKWEELIGCFNQHKADSGGSLYTRIYFPSVRSTKQTSDFKGTYPLYDQIQSLYFKDQHNNNLTTVKEIHELDIQGCRVAIFTGESLYSEIRKSLLGLADKRKNIEAFQDFLGNTFFNKETVTIIPNEDKQCLFVSIGKEPERPIHELGDGISQIMILTYPIFALKGKKIKLFIEEPELYLHPGLQRKLIESFLTLTQYDIQIFLTTHSNHLLDVFYNYEDVSIYTTRKEIQEEEGMVKFTVTPHSPEESKNLLDILEVSPSSMFMTNCHILVEGPSDKKIYQKLLSLYLRNNLEEDRYLEDVNYNFINVGGDNLNAYLKDGLLKISKIYFNPFIILDGDKMKEYKNSHGNIEFLIAGENQLEVEDLLPEKSWEKCKPLISSKKCLSDLNFKEHSSKIKFIKAKLSKSEDDENFKRKLKNELCNAFVNCEGMLWEDLNQISKSYTLKLYDHIKKSNDF